ncbi:SDR family NAD(P)-dependent oxidoreductase [Ferrimicrobium acidiphilum]|uniref:SDR family NAD(P)-dependent oxidoreductase n=1 Tax=Ferrimicrobium acidiphilum TaxID=121039 RepID=UPI0023F15060|nr:SDR family oxidoreductase [Ferrimicrobium acidiphilum]
MDSLRGQTVMVTGASSGIGAAMAAALLKQGARVAVCARAGTRLTSTVRHFTSSGLDALAIEMDVLDANAVERAVDEVYDRFGELDVLVNNAGIGMRTVNPRFFEDPLPFWKVPVDGFRAVIATNLTGYFLVARAVAPRMVTRGSGKIVMISMNHETMVRKGFVPYGPSRAGSEALAAIMAKDLEGTGVTVNTLLPGGVTVTGMIPEDSPPELRNHALPPEIMGPAIVFLASNASHGINGERIIATEFDEWRSAIQATEDRNRE